MANPVWPGTLPTSPLLAGFNESYESFNAEFEPDVGLSSTWPRSSSAKLTIPFSFFLTPTQRAALIAFWKSDCKTGSLPFDFEDPVTGDPITVKFIGGLRFVAGAGPRPWLAEINLVRLA